MTKANQVFKILVVDDSAHTLEVIQRNLHAAGYDAYGCSGVHEAVRFLDESTIDLVITDLRMPGPSGVELVRHVHENLKDVEIMMITGYPDVSDAVQAMKDGAGEFLVKPFTDDELLNAVDRMLRRLSNRRTLESPSSPARSYNIIGESSSMQQVFRRIQKAAATDANVLIFGDSGTGKELVARAIHYNSARRNAPFVPVNCTAIPESLLESELFGHVKGAFTGAMDHREGFFQIAAQGTVFLDEIGDASLNLQAKLLRVVQSREIRPVGSSRVKHVNTRIIAATHKDLATLVRKNLFREDLFYRINVIDIPLPRLVDRGDDLLLMIRFFLEKYAREMGRIPPAISDHALDLMRKYSWPGNVRELENLMQRLMVIVDGDEIRPADLPDGMRHRLITKSVTLMSLDDVITQHMRTVLAHVQGNKTRAAEILGIDRKTLRQKLKQVEPNGDDRD